MDTYKIFKNEDQYEIKNGLYKDENGNEFHYLNDLFHREDGPAVIWCDGSKEWYKDDLLHRIDGPACEFSDGTKEWWINGERHRIDGPAVIDSGGWIEWWYKGAQIDCSSLNERDAMLKFYKIIELKIFW